MKFENLKFENLSFGYIADNPIIKNVDFNFPLGEIVWIRGSSTSGKSIFIRLMSGAVEPTAGKIIINNQDIHELGYLHYASILKHIGFGFDGTGLLVNQSLENNLALPLRYHSTWSEAEIQTWVHTLMDIFRVTHVKDQRPAFVTQSLYKTFLLLRAFVLKPEMMIFINPLSSLDDSNRDSFISLLEVFKKDYGLKHVFIISDDEPQLEKLNPVKIWVQDKKIVREDSREEQRITG